MSVLKLSQALIFTVASSVAFTSHAALDKNERQIVKQVEQNMPQALDGLGLMGSGAHTKNETADLTSLSELPSDIASL